MPITDHAAANAGDDHLLLPARRLLPRRGAGVGSLDISKASAGGTGTIVSAAVHLDDRGWPSISCAIHSGATRDPPLQRMERLPANGRRPVPRECNRHPLSRQNHLMVDVRIDARTNGL